MLVAARKEASLQSLGWVLPLSGFVGGWASYLLVQSELELVKAIAVALLAGWAWLCIQPSVRHKFDKINSRHSNQDAVNLVTRSVQQGILFFSVPVLIFSTQALDPGQVLITGFVVLAALLSTIDTIYEKFIAGRQLVFVTFHSLCSFIAGLIILPIAVKIPMENSFNLALFLVLLWLIVGAPLNRRHNELSMRVFITALLFPLLIWSLKDHIPPAGILVESSVLTNGIANHEPMEVLSEVDLAQLTRGLYLYSSIRAPLGLSKEVIFNWRHGTYSGDMASTTTGGHEEGYRTYGLKNDFMPDALGHWTVDILTAERQLLDRVEFEVIPGPVYSTAFTVPRTALNTPRVTGLVIKPSM